MDVSGPTHNQTNSIHRTQGWVEPKAGLGIEKGLLIHLAHTVVTVLNMPFHLLIIVTTVQSTNQFTLHS